MHRTGSLLAVSVILLLTAVPHAWPALSVYMPPSELARRAPVVVEGTVIDVRSGLDPLTGSLATYITLDVGVVHRGPDDLGRVVVREPGGRFGDVVNVLDAVPEYNPGEQVFVFLEPAQDGALRTAGMFFGKFTLAYRDDAGVDIATRDLDGRGKILSRPTSRPESFRVRDLASLTASVRLDRRASISRRGDRAVRERGNHRRAVRPQSPWTASPPEIERLLWDDSRFGAKSHDGIRGGEGTERFLSSGDPVNNRARFTTLSSSTPARWYETDSGITLTVDIERANDPLGDGALAVAQIERALAAWTDVPESRISLAAGDTNADFTGSNPQSPSDAYPPGNIVLFGDPYDDISDPTGCSGVLAIGGYWRSGSTGAEINGQVFYRALRMYVIFSNDFECWLGTPDNLAEVATHELGHSIGLGHSTVSDAIMRSSAYGGRGPRLGDDDRDAVHCIYPHTLTVTSPDGGETLLSGDSHLVEWTSTLESGPDDGTVKLEYSTNNGDSWVVMSAQTNNDGANSWSVPETVSTEYLVRVARDNLVSPTPSPFPSSCSLDASNGTFTVEASGTGPLLAGAVPDGSSGTPLRVGRASGSDLTVTWGDSCSDDTDDYAVYEGTLSSLRSGTYNHAPVSCSAGVDMTETFTPNTVSSYYLVSPLAGSSEGLLGLDGAGSARPESASACLTRESDSTCP